MSYYIELSGKRGAGKKTLVDESTFTKYGHLTWYLSDTGYAVRRTSEGTVRLHRLVAGTPEGLSTDHKNHDRLDNRRQNLRICTASENMMNKSDQGKGYWFQKQNNNWVVEIKGIHRGTFETEAGAKSFALLVRQGKAYKKIKPERTECENGHSLEDAYQYAGYGKQCRTCQSLRSKEYYRRKHVGD